MKGNLLIFEKVNTPADAQAFIRAAFHGVHEYFELTSILGLVENDLGDKLVKRRQNLAEKIQNSTYWYVMAGDYAKGEWKISDKL